MRLGSSIWQHCNLPWPAKRAINVTINTAALAPQALLVVAMAAAKHPRFRLSDFILLLPLLTSLFFPLLFFFLLFGCCLSDVVVLLIGPVIFRFAYQRLLDMVNQGLLDTEVGNGDGRSRVLGSVACRVHPTVLRFAAFNGASIHSALFRCVFCFSRRCRTMSSAQLALRKKTAQRSTRLGVQW